MRLIDEKTESLKSRATVPLNPCNAIFRTHGEREWDFQVFKCSVNVCY
jgi:hypothetical protein